MPKNGCLALALLAGLWPAAIPPRFMPDEEMARQPIVVVARWDKAPLRGHSLVEGNVLKKLEGHTDLIVERVVKGDLKPGRHKLLLGAFIGWAKEGGPVFSHTSTEMVGDADDVTKPNLWFLAPKRSWDEADLHVYLALENYRAVQPLPLENYFRALGGDNYRTEVPKLLASRDPIVLDRTLAFLTGGVLPWPYGPGEFGEFLGWKARWKPLVEHAPAVESLLGRKEPRVRRAAAAVYADLAGPAAIPRMRQLLRDEDAELRGIASGVLIRHQDRASYEGIGRAVSGLKDPGLGCQLTALIQQAGDAALVPAAIEFLQNDGFHARLGDDFSIPAFKAQAALKALTGHDFPFDVVASRQAWEGAKALEPQKRREHLTRVLPYDPRPLTARLEKTGSGLAVVLTNRSDRALWLARVPDELGVTWTNGIGSGSLPDGDIKGKESFLQLAPGGSVRVPLDEKRLAGDLVTRVVVRYLHNGNQYGVNAWIGSVEVDFAGVHK
jgi:hypothetical protein